MKLTANAKRILSAMLVFMMVFSLVPMNVLAASDAPIDAAVIFTDLHTSKSNYKQSNVNSLFGALKNSGLPISSVTSGGDAFSVNEDSGKYPGYTGTITGDIVVKNGLSLESTARVYGNIVAGTISMSRGAVIKGTVSMENA